MGYTQLFCFSFSSASRSAVSASVFVDEASSSLPSDFDALVVLEGAALVGGIVSSAVALPLLVGLESLAES